MDLTGGAGLCRPVGRVQDGRHRPVADKPSVEGILSERPGAGPKATSLDVKEPSLLAASAGVASWVAVSRVEIIRRLRPDASKLAGDVLLDLGEVAILRR